MSDRIVAATRKGLFFFERSGIGWKLAGDVFLGTPINDNMSFKLTLIDGQPIVIGNDFYAGTSRFWGLEKDGEWRALDVEAPPFTTVSGLASVDGNWFAGTVGRGVFVLGKE